MPLLRKPAFAWLLLTLLSGMATADEMPTEPAGVVTGLQQTLLDIMRHADCLDFTARMDRLEPLLEATHDLPYIARLSAGRHWRTLGETRQRRFIETFSELSAASYAGRFGGYSGESFELAGTQTQPRGVTLVRTRLVRPGKEPIRFDYLLHRTAEGWRITNIVVDGVSDLALRRAEYSGVLRDDGFAALLEKMQAQIVALSAKR